MTEEEACVLLAAMPGVGSVRLRRLVEHFGSARKAVEARPRDLGAARVLPKPVIQKIFEFDRDNFLQSEYNLIRQFGVRVVTIFEDEYPKALREIHDAPPVLYIKGSLPMDDGLAVALVGSRGASVYGITVAEKFSSQLAELGITIVSGLARGIDAAAHHGALRTGGKTVAVLGCGLSHVYPEEHQELFESIGCQGAVISELPMATPPIAYNFPGRNRIISGMSIAVVVVEASLKSGALITADFALEQSRDVFAVPGKIDQPTSQGTNQLIRQGAKLVTCFEDVLQELEPEIRKRTRRSCAVEKKEVSSDTFVAGLSEEETGLVNLLSDEPVYIDELARQSGRLLSDVTSLLLKLELKKVIKQLPGKYFIKNL